MQDSGAEYDDAQSGDEAENVNRPFTLGNSIGTAKEPRSVSHFCNS